MLGERAGYIWISSFDQNIYRQLENVQIDRIFTDKALGKSTQKLELEVYLEAKFTV